MDRVRNKDGRFIGGKNKVKPEAKIENQDEDKETNSK